VSSVALYRAVFLCWQVLSRQLVTRGRLLGLSSLSALLVLISWLVGRDSRSSEALEIAVEFVANFGFTVLVPLACLIFASASLGDSREDGTLVYLWLRPMSRYSVVAGAWLASASISIPLTIVPMGLAAIFLDAGGNFVVTTILSTLLAAFAYCALFVFVGLLVKNSVLWGLVYVIVWEGLVATWSSGAAKLAIRGYARSMLTERTDVALDVGSVSQSTAVVGLILISIGFLVISGIRLNRLEVE